MNDVKEVFSKKYPNGGNFMTPDVERYGKINENLIYEISTGSGFNNNTVYGLTFLTREFERDEWKTPNIKNMSRSFHDRKEMEDFITILGDWFQ